MPYPKTMADLYRRLKAIGFPRSYVQTTILPDWWEDHLAEDPANRRLAEVMISKSLKIPLTALADCEGVLSLQGVEQARFRRWSSAEEASLAPAVAIARRVAEITLYGVNDLPALCLQGAPPDRLRAEILEEQEYVDLQALLSLCWRWGVPVLFVATLPPNAKRVEGMTLLVRGRPVILLASTRKAPAWLIWHLAHEMGHIGHGHLDESEEIDVKIRGSSRDPHEIQANDFAHRLVYGSQQGFIAPQHLKAETVAREANREGKVRHILPASIIASYAFHMDAWGVAQKALQILGQDSGGPEMVRDFLARHIQLDALGESDSGFLEAVLGI